MTQGYKRRAALLALAPVLLLALSGCGNTQGGSMDRAMGSPQSKERRLATEASRAVAQGRTEDALKNYETLHKRKPHDVMTAVNYAQLLRKTGAADKAVDVLAPFMKKDPHPLARSEYAAAQIALGNFTAAETTLNGVLEDQKLAEYHNDARHLMGVALDAQGHHKEAEQLFRLALEDWKGDPTSVMNNLALSLASQGMFDQSLETLRQALVMAPEKKEIARNIQIVSDLRAAVVPKAPVSLRKK